MILLDSIAAGFDAMWNYMRTLPHRAVDNLDLKVPGGRYVWVSTLIAIGSVACGGTINHYWEGSLWVNYAAEAGGIAASVAVVWLLIEHRREQQEERIRDSLREELVPIRTNLCAGIVGVLRHVHGEPTAQYVQPVQYVEENFDHICRTLGVDKNNGHSPGRMGAKYDEALLRPIPLSMPLMAFREAAEASNQALGIFAGQLVEYRTLLSRLRSCIAVIDAEGRRWEKMRMDRDRSFASWQQHLELSIRYGTPPSYSWADPDVVNDVAVLNMLTVAICALDLVVELSIFSEKPLRRMIGNRLSGITFVGQDYWPGAIKLPRMGAVAPSAKPC